ncbi:hypothetical protein Nizo2766_1138 [Lactiplantibacillus plantarum]|nr:hypothetical protein Nizo2757_1740 [Lactiplantibacillus plantarum]KZU46565.1 hypothetical protein Nizo2766_1138 [Lactiplantibacillus plantarum]QKX09222.1 hypothetical protein Heal19_500616 [Lactiplantibacillus plantarum]
MINKIIVYKKQRPIHQKLVHPCQPFEYCPDWKAFRPMLSGEISLSKRLVLG